MSADEKPTTLASEPDFSLGTLRVSPSACRVFAVAQELRVEAQTMTVLLVLVRAHGATVSRDELVRVCWQGRVVSDDAITRAIAKVRALARVTTPEAFTIETVPKVGYRLKINEEPIEAAASPPPGERFVPIPDSPLQAPLVETPPAPPSPKGPRPLLVAGAFGAIALAAVVVLGANGLLSHGAQQGAGATHQQAALAATQNPPIKAPDFVDALLNLDEQRVKLYLGQGWNPNWHLDSESNAALHILMEVCERNPTHDREALVRVAHLLVDAGEDINAVNRWGDTPFTIAVANRYCKPDHPVVAYLRGLAATRALPPPSGPAL